MLLGPATANHAGFNTHSKVAGSVHALIQNTNDSDAVAGRSKIDDMLLDATPPIARSNVGTALRMLWRLGQIRAGRFDEVGVAHSLGYAPMRYAIVEHPVEVAALSG